MPSNSSDHVPLLLTLDIDIQLQNTYAREFRPSVAWHKCDEVSIGRYKSKLDQQLLQINPGHDAWGCKNHKYKNHYEFIQSQYSNLINLWLEASSNSLPHTSNTIEKRHKIIAGWSEHVKEHKKYAKEYHDTWMQAGKPRQGDIAIKKRVSRLKFHYAIKYVTKENIRLRNIKMGEAVAGNDDRSL